MRTVPAVVLGVCLLLSQGLAWGQATDQGALGQMPVKEITIFKDGHAFVLHEGSMPTDARGDVVLDYLPTPVIGTFWAYADDKKAKLSSVVAGKHVVSVDRTALTVPEMIEGNVGATVRIKEKEAVPYTATIAGVPTRSSEELERASPPGAPPQLPVRAKIALLTVDGGTKAVPMDRIEEVTFLGDFKPRITSQEFRNVMTLKLRWDKDKTAEKANVGMVYVQRGVRWIPNYRVEIDGKGNAAVKLQATLINELTDLENVTAHLVIGVPTFAFQDTPDPISMQETVARLSRYMQPSSQSAYAFSNAIMSQRAGGYGLGYSRMRDDSRAGPAVDLGPEVAEGGKHEDLYVFTLKNVSLKKGQRMTVPVEEFSLKYKDVFVLDLPFGPPPEAQTNLNTQQQVEMARLLHAPKVMHVLRLSNKSKVPLTTAPALILRDGRVMAQGMVEYTAVGASSDLKLTTAVDVSVETRDKETGRTPNAQKWHGHSYDRINLAGSIRLTNRRDDKIAVEVRRSVLGFVDSATHEGGVEQLGRHEGGWSVPGGARPLWWRWYSWPRWWHHVNSVGQVNWTFDLKPGKSIELGYEWHYFWRW